MNWTIDEDEFYEQRGGTGYAGTGAFLTSADACRVLGVDPPGYDDYQPVAFDPTLLQAAVARINETIQATKFAPLMVAYQDGWYELLEVLYHAEFYVVKLAYDGGTFQVGFAYGDALWDILTR